MATYRLGCSAGLTIAISESEFGEIWNATERIEGILLAEERFAIVVDSYRDFEHLLLTKTLDMSIYGDRGWEAEVEVIHAGNRSLLGLLSASRLYLDQLKAGARIAVGVGPNDDHMLVSAVCNAASAEYEKALGYRAMEALRNHVQHRDLPLTQVTFNSDRPSEDADATLTLSLGIDLRVLRADSKFKANVLAELEQQPKYGDRVDLKPLVREYVAGLGRVQAGLRAATSANLERWATIIEGAIARLSDAPETGSYGAFVGRDDGTANPESRRALSTVLIQRIRKLRIRGARVGRLQQANISSAARLPTSPLPLAKSRHRQDTNE